MRFERWRVEPGQRVRLARVDPTDTAPLGASKERAESELAAIRSELDARQELFFADGRRALLVILQGMDTSGKDATLRHVFDCMNPQGVRAVAFKVPTPEELAHDFLWRIHAQTPRKGQITIFNRSQYEDVLVARVHRLVPARQSAHRYRAINEFERELVHEGTTVLKFCLHISPKEQAKRLAERLSDPTKQWKLSEADRVERGYWSDYTAAYEEMLTRTSTTWAPWYLIPSDHRWFRNWAVGRVVLDALRSMRLRYPPPSVDLAHYRID